MQNYSSIVVGVDFTRCSAIALAQGMRMAASTNAGLHVVHVIDALVVSELENSLSDLLPKVREGLLMDARKAWSEFAAGIPGASELPIGIRVDGRVEGILSAAKDVAADLLVLGAYGTDVPEAGVGSLAAACTRKAESDVLLARDMQTGPFRTIVACVDFSPGSQQAVRRAAAIAARDGAALHVLHAFRGPWHALHYRAPTIEAAPHFQTQYREGLSRRLEDFCRADLAEAGLTSAHIVVYDVQGPRSGIVEYAKHESADLIVLGKRGHSAVRDFFLGSAVERALRDTVCSVLAVKPPDAEQT